MVKHTFKILRCAHRKMFKVCLAIYWHYPWVVNVIFISINFCLAWWGCLLSTVSFVRRFVQVFCKKRPRWNGKTFLKTFFFLNNFWKYAIEWYMNFYQIWLQNDVLWFFHSFFILNFCFDFCFWRIVRCIYPTFMFKKDFLKKDFLVS